MNLRVLKFQLALHGFAALIALIAWWRGELSLWRTLCWAELGLVILPGILVLLTLAALHVLRGKE